MEIVSVYNDKGGVGKTTIAMQIASALAITGKRILLIDNDPQGSLSVTCARSLHDVGVGMDNIYKGKSKLQEMIVETHIDNMFLVPAGVKLKDEYMRVDKEIKSTINDLILFMKNNKTFLDLFDIVIIDNPPVQDGVALLFAMASDRIIMPVVPDEICFDALVRTYAFLNKQCLNFMDKYIVIVPSLVKNRSVHKKYVTVLKKEYSGKNDNTIVTDVLVTDRAEIPESMGNKQILFISHAASESADQFKKLCTDIFPWIDQGKFYSELDGAAQSKKQAIRDKFKKMIEEKRKIRETAGSLIKENVNG
jgi:cellulose biosynthesis protein BcsQ